MVVVVVVVVVVMGIVQYIGTEIGSWVAIDAINNFIRFIPSQEFIVTSIVTIFIVPADTIVITNADGSTSHGTRTRQAQSHAKNEGTPSSMSAGDTGYRSPRHRTDGNLQTAVDEQTHYKGIRE